jgi:hypothetical protein
MLGRYEAMVRRLRDEAGAAGVLALVLEGNRGNEAVAAVAQGFKGKWRALVPQLLRQLADRIERGEGDTGVPLVAFAVQVGEVEPCGECEGCKRYDRERRLSVN